jgi:hypothetical protein
MGESLEQLCLASNLSNRECVEIVAGSAMRLIACAGALAGALLLGGAGAGISMAGPGESADAGSDGVSASADIDDSSDGVRSAGSDAEPDNDRPTSTVGNGREDTDQKPSGGEGTNKPHSLSISVFRMPVPEEFAGGWPNPSVFFSTVEVPVPSIDGFLTALSQPKPEPTPSPSFRTQEEAPVVDAMGSGGDGGVDPVAAGRGEPPVFEVPLVVAPPMPIPAVAAPAGPLAASTPSGGPSPAVGAQTTAAGARAPSIRGSLAPTGESASGKSLTPMGGQATRVGYPRSLRNPTVGELAAVALPGLAGLMLFTFSGGVIGYRQANSIRFLRTASADRFLE